MALPRPCMEKECHIGISQSREPLWGRYACTPEAALLTDRDMREFPRSRRAGGAMLNAPICSFFLSGTRGHRFPDTSAL